MEEKDGVRPQKIPKIKTVTSDDHDNSFEAGTSSALSFVASETPPAPLTVNDDEIWALVREYKEIREEERQLRENNSNSSLGDSSTFTDISDQSLIEQQLDTLAELDSQASEIATSIVNQGSSDNPDDQTLLALAVGVEANPPQGARPSVAAALKAIKVQKPLNQSMTDKQLRESVQQLTTALKCGMNEAFSSQQVTTAELMDSTT